MEMKDISVDDLQLEVSVPVLKSISSGYWYLATPYTKYTAGIEAAFVEACRIAAWLIGQDVSVYSPIAHTHPIAIHGRMDPVTNHSLWLRADKPLMLAAHGLVVVRMAGWDESIGIAEEMEVFRAERKPVVFLDWPRR